jgi:hypothetical protein
MVEKYELKEDRIMSPREEDKKLRNGRAQKMQGDKYALRGNVEL